MHAEENKRRTLQKSDIATAVSKSDMYDFLIDIVPRDIDLIKASSKSKGPEVRIHINLYNYNYFNIMCTNYFFIIEKKKKIIIRINYFLILMFIIMLLKYRSLLLFQL